MFEPTSKPCDTAPEQFLPHPDLFDFDSAQEDLAYAEAMAHSIASQPSYDWNEPDAVAPPAWAGAPQDKLSEQPLDIDFYLDQQNTSPDYGVTDIDTWLDLAPEADQFTPIPRHNDLESVLVDGPVDDRTYAEGLAIDAALRRGWRHEHVALLVDFFERYSKFNGAKSLLERLALEGTTPDELPLALVTREIWASYPEFSYVPPNYDFCSPDMNWDITLAVVRHIGLDADPSEIEAYLQETFETWYARPSLISKYGSFQGYLKHLYVGPLGPRVADEAVSMNFEIGYNYALTTATQLVEQLVGARIA